MGIPYFHFDVFERYFSMFRDACEAEGYTADPLQAGWLVPIYVAETDEQARKEYEEHLWYFVKRLLPGITIQPPGYTSARSLAQHPQAARARSCSTSRRGSEIIEGRYAIVGSPETVADTLDRQPRPARHRQPARAVPARQPAARPHREEHASCSRSKVLPRLRAEFPEGAPVLPARRRRSRDAASSSRSASTRRSARSSSGAAGSGPPLVYLHSAGGEHVAPGARAARRVATRSSCRSSPASRSPRGIEEIDGMEDAVFHLLDLWELLGLDAPPILGLSLGGWMALELATRYPERVVEAGARQPGRASTSTARRSPRCSAGRPGELADMLFADQSYPIAAAMHAMDAFAGDVGQRDRDPARVRAADVEGARRDRAPRLGPVPAQPEAARPAAAHHRADARSSPARRTGWCRRSTPRRSPPRSRTRASR